MRGLPPCLVAIATDGIRKAKRRQVDSGSTAVIQPKIVMGLEKVLVDRYVRRKIDEGMEAEERRSSSRTSL